MTSAKQRRILLAARLYLAGYGTRGYARLSSPSQGKPPRASTAPGDFLASEQDQPCRCDVVLLDGVEGGVVDWLQDAFGE